MLCELMIGVYRCNTSIVVFLSSGEQNKDCGQYELQNWKVEGTGIE